MPEGNDFKEQLRNLIELQKVDTEIFDMQSQKDTFPVRLKEMDDSLETKKGGMESADEELKRLKVSKNEKEVDLKSKEELISKHESNLYQIKNNKEYSAIKSEIESVQADVSLLEEDIINLFDALEAAQLKGEDEKKIFEDEKKNVENEKTLIKDEEKKLTDKITELTAKRDGLVNLIETPILAQYSRILENRGRVALSRINGEFCGECNMQLRPQVINEAIIRKNIVTCENCARMLYEEEK